MKPIIKFLIVVLFLVIVASATETTWRHSGFEVTSFDINLSSTFNITELRVLEWGWNTSTPSVSDSNRARMYYDNNNKKVMQSINGGGYEEVMTNASNGSALFGVNGTNITRCGSGITCTSNANLTVTLSVAPVTYSIINVTQNYTIANSSMTLFNVSADLGTVNVTLPTMTGTGNIFTITKTDASSNAVQINVTGNCCIDGAAWANITSQWTSLDLVDINSMWKIK